MRYGVRILTLLLLLSGLSGRVWAQTAYGPGGLFVHPTAFTSARGTPQLNVSYFTQQISGQRETEWLPVSFTYSPTDRSEIGALYLNRRAGSHRGDSGGLFGKYQLVPDSVHAPAVAIAGSWLSGDVKLASLAGVVSHSFRYRDRAALTAHLGVQWARRADIANAQDDTAGFGGLELPIGKELSLVGELGSRFRFDRSQTSAVGLMWAPSRSLHVGIGFVNVGRSTGNRFFVGVGYRLGGGH